MDIYIELILTLCIVLGIIIWLTIMGKRKSKYGLNFIKRVCSVCSTEQSIIRVPKNKNQILFGGYTCPTCQAALDKYGDVIL